MMKQTEVLKLLVEALSLYETRTDGLVNKALAAGKEALAQPDQYAKGYADAMNWKIQNHLEHLPAAQKLAEWKLVPKEPTREMLEAMDECSTEGYDERLYAGHAASVYMAAVDVAPIPPQPKEPEREPAVFLKEWSDWRDMVVVNIMRHGSIDKHLARELVEHFQNMTPQRTWVGLTDDFLQQSDYHLLHRFIETTEDDEGYDIGKEAVKRLAELGVVQSHGFGKYSVTMFGYWVHERYWEQNPSLPLKTNADRAIEAKLKEKNA